MDGDPENVEKRILPSDLIEYLPSQDPPTWALPIELQSAEELDREIVRFCKSGMRKDSWNIDWSALYDLVGLIWRRRLPLEGEEVWAALDAHGVPKKFKTDIVDFFDKGRALLVREVGRKPVKKKRVPPHST